MTASRPHHTRYTIYDTITAIVLAETLFSALGTVRSALQQPLSFDDSYMFARYAHQLHAGHGFSWNADAIHTYGPTSLLWSAAVWLNSFLPSGNAWTKLVLLSFFFAVCAAIAMAWAVAANLPDRDPSRDPSGDPFRGTLLLRTFRALPWVALPLGATAVLRGNQATGMETMLALFLCALFTGAALLWRNGRCSAWRLAGVGVLLYLARPEGALVSLGLPFLLWIALPGTRPTLRSLATVLGATLAGIAAQLALCKLYFGTPVPLSVYMKGAHAYLGYRGVWHPELLLAALLLAAWPYVALSILFARGRTLRLVLCCAAPVAAIYAYLQTVTQIMGFHSRYYVPYLPLLVIPALLALANALTEGRTPEEAPTPMRPGTPRIAATLLLFLALAALSSEGVMARVRHAENRAREEYDAPTLTMTATKPLPTLSWQNAAQQLTDLLVRPLPAGTIVAATEVGYLGERAPQVDILDLAGLNDTTIALHGFQMDDLLARHPDLIWLPNTDYTHQRGVMLADPRFLEQYDLYAGAANYGIALRKTSPHYAAIDSALRTFWAAVYPGYDLDSYRVTAAAWTGRHHTVRGE